MTQAIDSLIAIAGQYDAVVLDQWGVLHDGTMAYPGALGCVAALRDAGIRLAVLSNSGKRTAPNAARIAEMGFDRGLFDLVMTSGEALWQDIAKGAVTARILCPIERAKGDASVWARGLGIELTEDPTAADAILLMGLPDGADPERYDDLLQTALARDLPVLCTNPDRAAPRAGGTRVVSPGALAHAHLARRGRVQFYGKPHGAVFQAVASGLGVAPARLLMVGDSLEHDVAGAAAAGWSTAFIRGGLHAAAFAGTAAPEATLRRLAAAEAAPLPTYSLQLLV